MTTPQTHWVKVWDLPVRIFHWALVAAFVFSYITGEEDTTLHSYSGYFITGLVIFRIVWGLIGSHYARFSEFLYSPRTVLNYIHDMRAGKGKRYLGHNPAGGYMIVAMLMTLSVVVLSGMKLYAEEEGKGPFAQNNVISMQVIATARASDDDDEKEHGEHEDEFWEEVHETAVNFMILLVLLHIGGVVMSGKKHDENLVSAMISGKKRDNE
ncbi:cytochrome b/b6 domain-containing protein [Paraneptunicella aestuarii]|uniref:cytochrome b/b6 domain-containing protein n=1 Tax=Paraneptunicella aestuarii TaxID=2831148 RepID=UPI001E4F5C8C|nr:cytochrome b/b6 domain-containing protein [Paraneptunicella aestuarii]UAA39038.1 cytochrome b/b6 domain-containing protein [Paraneptunicella aestuarii]